MVIKESMQKAIIRDYECNTIQFQYFELKTKIPLHSCLEHHATCLHGQAFVHHG